MSTTCCDLYHQIAARDRHARGCGGRRRTCSRAVRSRMPLDPLRPADAQYIVIAYARLLERDLNEDRRRDSLPFTIETIKTAIRSSMAALAKNGQLAPELRSSFETAYVCLADYQEFASDTLRSEFHELLTAADCSTSRRST